jgi:hypothetical protein
MKSRVLRGLCVAAGLLCWAAAAAAQDNVAFSTERMSRAQDDIAKMDETELRSLTAVLVDCSYLRVIAAPQALAACQSAREKYRIEYSRGRAIDEVLYLLTVAAVMRPDQGPGQSTTLSFEFEVERPGRVTMDEIKRVLESTSSVVLQPIVPPLEEARRAPEKAETNPLPQPNRATQITVDEIRRALAQTQSAIGQPKERIGEVEQTLRRKISETFRSRRAQ